MRKRFSDGGGRAAGSVESGRYGTWSGVVELRQARLHDLELWHRQCGRIGRERGATGQCKGAAVARGGALAVAASVMVVSVLVLRGQRHDVGSVVRAGHHREAPRCRRPHVTQRHE